VRRSGKITRVSRQHGPVALLLATFVVAIAGTTASACNTSPSSPDCARDADCPGADIPPLCMNGACGCYTTSDCDGARDGVVCTKGLCGCLNPGCPFTKCTRNTDCPSLTLAACLNGTCVCSGEGCLGAG